MSDYLPEQVVVEILSRLPVKPLLRFRCVSKSWNSLITSPKFISTHIQHSESTHTLLTHYSLTHYQQLFSYHHTTTFHQYQSLKCPLKPKNNFYFRINGSCNGLICLTDDCFGYTHTNTVFLWNPSIQKHLKLPLPHADAHIMSAYGFGFDRKTNDYKVIRISFQKKHDDGGYVFPPHVHLYKLTTRSWNDWKGDLPAFAFGIGDHFWSQVFLNGYVHWLAFKNINPYSCFILIFHVGDEMFGEMQLPENLVTEFPLNLSVTQLGESLAVLQYNNCVHSKLCTVWVMEKYGAVESWSKRCTIDLQRRLVKTIGLRKNGDLFLAVGKELVSYNYLNGEMKKLGVKSTQDGFCIVDSYRESLVLLKEGDVLTGEIESSQGEDDEPRGLGIEHSEYGVKFFTHRAFCLVEEFLL